MYLINRLVEFNPENQTLSNRVSGKVVHLQVPATQCFLYLIIQQGNVISQSTLLKIGWGDRNEVTTSNTFYQTILLLRNALVDVGLSRDTVRTMSRRGLILDGHINIEAINPDAEKLIEAAGLSELTSERTCYIRIVYACVLCLMIVFILWGGFSWRLQAPFKNFVPIASSLQMNNQCHLYAADHDMSFDYYNEFIRKHPELCAKQYHIFISGYRQTGRIVAFVCHRDPRMNDNAICSTHYHYRWQQKQ